MFNGDSNYTSPRLVRYNVISTVLSVKVHSFIFLQNTSLTLFSEKSNDSVFILGKRVDIHVYSNVGEDEAYVINVYTIPSCKCIKATLYMHDDVLLSQLLI